MKYITKIGNHDSGPDGCSDDCRACARELIANDCNLIADHVEELRESCGKSADGHDLINAIDLAAEYLAKAFDLQPMHLADRNTNQ